MAPTALKISLAALQKPVKKSSSKNQCDSRVRIGQLTAAILANGSLIQQAFAEEGLTPPDLSYPSEVLPSAPVDVSSVTSFVADNPILVGGGAFVLATPFIINALVNAGQGGSGIKPTSAARALSALQDDARVVLIDVRSRADVKATGSPDLRSVKRSAISLPLTNVVKGEVVVDEKWADKFAGLRAVTEESLVILLDADGKLARKAGAAVANQVSKIYYVDGGAASWQESAPWKAPSKGISLAVPDLRSAASSLSKLADDVKEAPTTTKAVIAGAALFGAAFLFVNEIEVLLEVAGIAAAANFVLSRLLFAEEREKTLTEIRTLVDDKVAVKEVGSDLSKIAKAVIEDVEALVEADKPAAAVAATVPAPAAPVATEEEAKEEETTGSKSEAREWIENWRSKSSTA